MNKVAFRHSFNAGDVIYSLWSVKKFCLDNNVKADYYQHLNKMTHHEEGHPTRTKEMVMVTLNNYMYDMMKPLIESLPFIDKFLPWQGEQAVNLDRIREININLPFGDIRKWYGYAYPDMQVDIGSELFGLEEVGGQWLPEYRDAVVINRTTRYRNDVINYGFLQRIKNPIYFVGALEEYADMLNWVPKAKYVKVKNFKELASVIASSKLFIGNQSFCFALAEAMKSPRVLEVSPKYPNVITAGPNGYDFMDNQCFEQLVKMRLEK
jgi:hypothetical protein